MKKFFLNKRVLISLGTIALVAMFAVASTNAFFSDTETSTGNTFTAGSIDLSLGGSFSSDSNGNSSFALDSDNNGRALYNFTDLKPGDMGGGSFNLKVSSNDAYVCAKSSITSTPENGIIDPESDAGDVTGGNNGGELQNYVQFATFDDENGNGILDGGEPLNVNQYGGDSNGFTAAEIAAAGWVPVAQTVDYPNSWLVELSLPTGVEQSAGILYCFGNFDLNGDCSAPVGDQNDAMTDQMVGSIEFYAVQTRNNDGFTCSSLNKTVLELENKDSNWNIISNDPTYGHIAYSNNDTSFNGTVTGTGLVVGGKYQITLNGPGTCTFTDNSLANYGVNAFESGYWNAGVNLEPTCGTPGEGVYNMDLIGDHYTFIADGSGAFTHNFNMALPAGDYTGVKVLVKKMLDTHVAPWADTGTGYAANNLYETAPISFTVL